MEWSDLQLVAVEAPRSDPGAAIGQPLVRTADPDVFYVIGDVDVDPPALNTPISRTEYGQMLRSREWVALPQPHPPRRRHLSLVITPALQKTLAVTGALEYLPKLQRIDAGYMLYVDRDKLCAFRVSAVDRVIGFAMEEARISSYTESWNPEGTRHHLRELREMVRQTILLTDQQSPKRGQVYLDLAEMDELLGNPISATLQELFLRDFGKKIEDVLELQPSLNMSWGKSYGIVKVPVCPAPSPDT